MTWLSVPGRVELGDLEHVASDGCTLGVVVPFMGVAAPFRAATPVAAFLPVGAAAEGLAVRCSSGGAALKVVLHGIGQLPGHVPGWDVLMDNLGNPPVERVARVLGLSVDEVSRFNETGGATRVACLALFWLTTWGREAVHAQAVNDARLMAQVCASLEGRVVELERKVVHLSALGEFGASNEPLLVAERCQGSAVRRVTVAGSLGC